MFSVANMQPFVRKLLLYSSTGCGRRSGPLNFAAPCMPYIFNPRRRLLQQQALMLSVIDPCHSISDEYRTNYRPKRPPPLYYLPYYIV